MTEDARSLSFVLSFGVYENPIWTLLIVVCGLICGSWIRRKALPCTSCPTWKRNFTLTKRRRTETKQNKEKNRKKDTRRTHQENERNERLKVSKGNRERKKREKQLTWPAHLES